LLLVCFFGAGCSDEPSTRPCTSDEQCADLPCASGSLALCAENQQCTCASEIPLGRVGRFSAVALAPTGEAFVSAYNDTYGDLMLGHLTPPGVVRDWEFVDGVPDGPVVLPQTSIRQGIRAAGDDVGRYTALATGADGQPCIAYQDLTHGALRFARRDPAGGWHIHVIDSGEGGEDQGGDTGSGNRTVGRFASLSLAPSGAPGVAYFVDTVRSDGAQSTELRFAQARQGAPQSGADWSITRVDGANLAAPPPDAAPAAPELPDGVGLFPSLGRLADGRPVIAYYDHQRGNLVLATGASAGGGRFTLAILDGEDGSGRDTGDVGLYPSLAVEAGDILHVTYVDAPHAALHYLNTRDHAVEIVDDGYRVDGKNAEGLDQPVFHFVGDDSALALYGGGRLVVYQDATSHELLAAVRGPAGTWTHTSIAGSAPDDGAFGFYTRLAQSGTTAIISSYVINQRARPPQFFVQLFTHTLSTP
jgi:hypothetical protein